jgi:hypothetical protein
MPFKITPGLVIVGIIVLALVIGGIAVAASGGGRKTNTKPAGTYTCTVSSNVGLLSVTIINQNTRGGPMTVEAANLPFSFNFTSGDTLQFNATVTEQFEWNVWKFVKIGTWSHDNPLTIRPEEDFTLAADCKPIIR